jgi:hypothetical protein
LILAWRKFKSARPDTAVIGVPSFNRRHFIAVISSLSLSRRCHCLSRAASLRGRVCPAFRPGLDNEGMSEGMNKDFRYKK